MLEMRRIRDSIVPLTKALIGDPNVAEERDRPVGRWNVSERMKEKRVENEVVEAEQYQSADCQQREHEDRHW